MEKDSLVKKYSDKSVYADPEDERRAAKRKERIEEIRKEGEKGALSKWWEDQRARARGEWAMKK